MAGKTDRLVAAEERRDTRACASLPSSKKKIREMRGTQERGIEYYKVQLARPGQGPHTSPTERGAAHRRRGGSVVPRKRIQKKNRAETE